jgi:hypothetical protein
MLFIINPPAGAKRIMSTKRKRKSTARRSGAKRRPPKGFRSWKTYMASIRPGAKRRARSNPTGGAPVASKKRRRRKATTHTVRRRRRSTHATARHTTHRRRRARRNPPAILKQLVPFATSAVVGAVTTTGGKVWARKARALLKQQPGTPLGMAAEGLVALVTGMVVARFHPSIGRDIAVGGLQSPLEAGLSKAKLPFVGDALGSDDYYLGFGDAVDTIQGGGFAGYVGPADQVGDDVGEMGGGTVGGRFMAA